MTEDSASKPPKGSKKHAAAVRSFLKEIRQLTAEVEGISEFHPFAFRSLNTLSATRTGLESKYREALYHAEQISRGPSSSAGLLDAAEIARLSAASITATVHVHQSWNELGAIIDRKYAFYLAIISLYVSLISFASSLIGLAIPLIPRG